jgi:hypothetical protein
MCYDHKTAKAFLIFLIDLKQSLRRAQSKKKKAQHYLFLILVGTVALIITTILLHPIGLTMEWAVG